MDPLLTVAIAAAREAGGFIMTQYGNTASIQKIDKSPVTEADLGAHTRIMEALRHTEIPILSEETLDNSHITHPYPDTLWIIDPLDGTRDYIEGTGDFSVMIGLLCNGRPALGVVYAPVTDTLYYAESGKGAFMVRDGTTIRLSASDALPPHLHLIRSKNHYSSFMAAVADKLAVTKATPHGSVGIKAGLLGTQNGDFFLYTGALGVWDICAPEIIVTEAGGKVTDIAGTLIAYVERNHRLSKGIVFSNGTCHAHVLTAIAESL